MQSEVENVLSSIAHCLVERNELLQGRATLVLHTNILSSFNKFLSRYERENSDIILTDIQRRDLEQFQQLIGETAKLCLKRSLNSQSLESEIDLSRFKKLIRLELTRIPINLIKDISQLKSQLQFLYCSRCQNEESLSKKGKLQWAGLVYFSYQFRINHNSDFSFLVSMPWLQRLNLSHNNLKEIDGLENLNNLNYLDVSFNFLRKIPILSDQSRPKLKVLNIDHNFIEDFQGIETYVGLIGLDISWNFIAERSKLAPLLELKSLCWIIMKNNPFSFSRFYRIYLATVIKSRYPEFQIDNQKLSTLEYNVMGCEYALKGVKFRNSPSPQQYQKEINIEPTRASVQPIKVKQKVGKTLEGKIHDTTESDLLVVPSTSKSSSRQVLVENEPSSGKDADKRAPKLSSSKENDINNLVFKDKGDQIKVKQEVNLDVNDPIDIKNGNSSPLEEVVFVKTVTTAIMHVSTSHPLNDENPTLESVETDSELIKQTTQDSEPNYSALVNYSKTTQLNNFESNPPTESDNQTTQMIVNDSNSTQIFAPSSELEPGYTSGSDQYEEAVENQSGLSSNEDNVNNKDINRSIVDNKTNKNYVDKQFIHQIEELKNSCSNKTNHILDGENTVEKSLTSMIVSNVKNDFKVEETESNSKDQFQSTNHEKSIVSVYDSAENLSQTSEISNSIETQSESESHFDSPERPGIYINENDVVSNEASVEEKLSDEDISIDSDTDEDEILWQVEKYDSKTEKTEVIFIALMEKVLKERSTSTGQLITKWPLHLIQSCVKTRVDPITIELEFDVSNVENQHRCYIMEFADAQTIMKKIYRILDSRTLGDMNQFTYKCSDCSSQFVFTKSKDVTCAICGGLNLTEMEEAQLPNSPQVPSGFMSHSHSQSSLGSAVSLEQHSKHDSVLGCNVPRKCESDIEIISNPSQSSIEVIDEHNRSQSTTPNRKRSSEERQTVLAPQLDTVLEVTVPLSALTESSSSGSLTESVITAYETHNNPKKNILQLESLLDEDPLDNKIYINQPEVALKEVNINNPAEHENTKDVYCYSNFADVDHRIMLYLYKHVFSSECEKIQLLVRSHIWKTGGSDFDGCFVISTTSIYVLFHSRTDFSNPSCDWLTKSDSYDLRELKSIAPMLYNQGIEVKINNINFLLLLMDHSATDNFLNFAKALPSLKSKVSLNWNQKLNLILQEAVLGCETIYDSVKHDPDKKIDPSVNYFTICKSITINRDEIDEEILRLGGLIITAGEFYLIPGDLSWLCSPSNKIVPSIQSAQEISRLIEVKKNKLSNLAFHFLYEEEAVEEVWSLNLTSAQIFQIINYIEGPWEKLFSTPLEITFKC